MSKRIFLALLMGIFFLSACGPARIELTGEDNGSELEVNMGDQIVISLPGNPTTGYTWEVIDLDRSMFEPVGETEFISDNPDLVGSGGIQILTFEVAQQGTGTLTLVYHRPWETDVEPIDIFTLTVTGK